MPEKYIQERGRLIDAYADGHKYVFDASAVVYGEEDLVTGLASFLSEVGIIRSFALQAGNPVSCSQESFSMTSLLFTGAKKSTITLGTWTN